MRLNLYWRGRDVIDVEVHVWRPRQEESPDEGPPLEATAGGLFERAEPMGEPDTSVSFGFGCRARLP